MLESAGEKKQKARKEKAPKQPKAAKPKREASTPFWKKELSVGRKSQPAKVDELDPETPLVEKPEKVPFWKKEIGGKKQASEPKAAREAKPKPAGAGGG